MKITKTMIKNLQKSIKNWTIERHAPDFQKDKSLKEMYKNDRQDLRKVLNLIRTKKPYDAALFLYNLDTVVRDQVPTALYDTLMDEYYS